MSTVAAWLWTIVLLGVVAMMPRHTLLMILGLILFPIVSFFILVL
jgi:hypothetical protein